ATSAAKTRAWSCVPTASTAGRSTEPPRDRAAHRTSHLITRSAPERAVDGCLIAQRRPSPVPPEDPTSEVFHDPQAPDPDGRDALRAGPGRPGLRPDRGTAEGPTRSPGRPRSGGRGHR